MKWVPSFIGGVAFSSFVFGSWGLEAGSGLWLCLLVGAFCGVFFGLRGDA
jgi:membrane protease YdiL (CAAX protease family)